MTLARVVVAVLAVVVMGCASPAPSATPPPSRSSPEPAATTQAATRTAAATPSAAPGELPPDAALLVAEGDPVVGQLGSYTWGQAGSDSPWLPGAAAVVDGAMSLRFGLSFDVPVAEWQARYSPPGEPAPERPVGLDAGALPLEVASPPDGSWTVALTVVFAGGRGDATYYWRIEVR
jgi:hypothetical protein